MAPTIPLGILFNAFVTAVVSATAFAFVLFLGQRWRRLPDGMKAYAWFWAATGVVWGAVTVRYLMVVANYLDDNVHRTTELVLEAAVFTSGAALFYYLGMQLFQRRSIARSLTFGAIASGVVALWYLLQPNGFHPAEITAFTADPIPGLPFLAIFGVMAGLALLLLIHHALKSLRAISSTPTRKIPYDAFYSLTLAVYVMLGIVDQMKLIIDWPLLVFRVLYTAVFLAAYLTLTSEEAHRETYLEERGAS